MRFSSTMASKTWYPMKRTMSHPAREKDSGTAIRATASEPTTTPTAGTMLQAPTQTARITGPGRSASCTTAYVNRPASTARPSVAAT